MKKNEFNLRDFAKDFGYFHVKIDKKFLKNILIKASKSKKPHYNKKFIIQLGMNLTKGKDCCLTIYGWTAYEKTIPLEKLVKIVKLSNTNWKKVESKIIFIRCGQKGGEICPKFPIKIDAKLGSIIGHILGDGSIDKKYQQISFSNSNKELLKEFDRNMGNVFQIKPRIWMQKAPDFGNTSWDKKLKEIEDLKEGRNCSLFYPKICGLILNKIFNNFAIGKNKSLTKEILKTNKKFKSELIKSFFDDESTIDKKGNYIRVFQDRKEILELFRKLLVEFQISSSNIFTYMKRDKKRYYFNIYKKTNFIRFQEKIGFTSTKKASKLSYLATIRNLKNSK